MQIIFAARAPILVQICAGLLATLPSSSATAQDVNALEAKIREQDGRIRELERKLEALLAKPPAVPSAFVPAPSSSNFDNPPAAKSDEMTIKLRGRLQVDALLLDRGGKRTTMGTQVRRLYLGAEGKIAGGFRYQAEADFAGNSVALQDALVAYRASESTEIIAGYFKPQITADDMTSDVQTLFLERSAYAGIFAPGRRIGIGVNHAGKDWGIRVGIFGEKESAALDGDRDEAWLASIRAHADLLPGPDVLHVAVEGYYTKPSATDHLVSLSQRPESNRAPTVVDTGTFQADHGIFGGVELAWEHGPFGIQFEGGVLDYQGPVVSPRFRGYSAQASWRVTGETRPYDGRVGTFGRVSPARPLTNGGWGALEAGWRFTHVDLTDNGIEGGKLITYGAVINWYPVTRVRISANLIHADVKRNSHHTHNNLLSFRGAVDW